MKGPRALKIILTVSLTLILILAVAGCGKEIDNKQIDNAEAYMVYVAYTESGGKLTYEQWLDTIKGEKGDAGIGIASITKTGTEGLVDTYTITFTDGSITNYTITNGVQGIQGPQGEPGIQGENGKGIESIIKTSSTCYKDIYTVTFSNGTTTTIEIDNNGSGHIYDDWIVISNPTDMTYGIRVRFCSVCGASDFDVISPGTHIHNWGEWTVTVEPTCTEDGTRIRTCLDCDEHEEKVVVAPGHTYVNGICTVCGAEEPTEQEGTEGLQYMLKNDNTYEIVNYSGTAIDIVIPALYNGKPVTSIRYKAFYNNDKLTNITIPNNVISIGWEAFYNCIRLTSISFEGTRVQWNAIDKGNYWDGDNRGIIVYCTDGTFNDYYAQAIEYNGNRYYLFEIHKSWTDAKEYCERIGGHLATITSAEEQAFIEANFRGDYWLGGTDKETEGVWEWITGEEWNYSNWGDGEPNNMGGEDYLAIWPVNWNDLCDDSYEQTGFICEWEKE